MPAPTEPDRPAPRARIGTQGWNYPAWVGPLYPFGTRAPDYLRLYARAFDTVEVDSTFYAVPAARTVRGWAERTPDRFIFSLKLPREITHERRLDRAGPTLEEFTDRARELGDKLGPILIQMGPDFSPAERPALERFLPLLPGDLRFALEFRQRGWFEPGTLELLRDHGVALALSDGRWVPRDQALHLLARPTTDFVYLRWMGENRDIEDYSHLQIDRTSELHDWAHAIQQQVAAGTYLFGYINNHFSGHSPATARQLLHLLGESPVAPDEIADQMSLF